MTIAAAIIMVAILSALWFQFSRKQTPDTSVKQDAPVTPTNVTQPESSPEQKQRLLRTSPKSQSLVANSTEISGHKQAAGNRREVSAPTPPENWLKRTGAGRVCVWSAPSSTRPAQDSGRPRQPRQTLFVINTRLDESVMKELSDILEPHRSCCCFCLAA
jgi:hypothetical protein